MPVATKKRTGRSTAASRSARGKASTSASRRRRRARPGTARRRALVLAGFLSVAASLLISVDRTAEGRLLAESINAYGTEEQLLLTRLSEELVRVDSLASRERILVVGARYGLRPAADDEVLHLPDVGP